MKCFFFSRQRSEWPTCKDGTSMSPLTWLWAVIHDCTSTEPMTYCLLVVLLVADPQPCSRNTGSFLGGKTQKPGGTWHHRHPSSVWQPRSSCPMPKRWKSWTRRQDAPAEQTGRCGRTPNNRAIIGLEQATGLWLHDGETPDLARRPECGPYSQAREQCRKVSLARTAGLCCFQWVSVTCCSAESNCSLK